LQGIIRDEVEGEARIMPDTIPPRAVPNRRPSRRGRVALTRSTAVQ
jgi:hypothetical protein